MKKLIFLFLILVSCAVYKEPARTPNKITQAPLYDSNGIFNPNYKMPPAVEMPKKKGIYKEPDFPLGKPDEISRYSGEGGSVISYTYFCYKGQYIVYTYTQDNILTALIGHWNLPSIYTSTGICNK